jgi:hypothetical protein
MILNSEFQARVFDSVASHAVVNSESDSTLDTHDLAMWPVRPIPENPEPSMCLSCQDGEGLCRLPSAASAAGVCPDGIYFSRMQSFDQICTAQYIATATIIHAGLVPGAVAEPPALGIGCQLPGHVQSHHKAKIQETLEVENRELAILRAPSHHRHSQHSAYASSSLSQVSSSVSQHDTPAFNILRTRSDSTVASSGALTVPEIMCQFLGGVFPVWVTPAPAKAVARMTEKIKEYAAEGAEWPRSACILDPVRATVVCDGAAQILEVAEWFLASSPAAAVQFPVCRIKNKFSLSSSELVSALSSGKCAAGFG